MPFFSAGDAPLLGPPGPRHTPRGWRIVGVRITNENGTWKINGTVLNPAPGTRIRISSSNPLWDGRSLPVEDDGSFDIGFPVDDSNPGGSIGIIAETPGIGRSNEIRRTFD